MYFIIAKVSFLMLLFILGYISINYLLLSIIRRRTTRMRLTNTKQNRLELALQKFEGLNRHLLDLIAATRYIPSVSSFMIGSFLLGLFGLCVGAFFFRSVQGVISLTMVLFTFPYLLLRVKLISKHMRTRLEFLPAIEVFYQQYLLALRPNIRVVLHSAITGDRLQYPIKSTFISLHSNLIAGKEPADALRVFEMELGHVWGTYFSSMLQIAMTEGIDISSQLKELIGDMRRAQMFDSRVRNRLLEIRLASFSPIWFLLLFVGINFKLNPENSYQFYIVSAEGRNMLLQALLLIFASFLMGIYLSMKRL